MDLCVYHFYWVYYAIKSSEKSICFILILECSMIINLKPWGIAAIKDKVWIWSSTWIKKKLIQKFSHQAVKGFQS